MSRQSERKAIIEKSMRLCDYLGRINSLTLQKGFWKDDKLDLSDPAYINRSALELKRIFTSHGFIMTLTDQFSRLMEQAGKGDDIGLEGIVGLQDFLDEYSDLLAEEYNWCK